MKIINEQLVTDVYGKWPSFHDAEIHEILMRRNIDKANSPELILTIDDYDIKKELVVEIGFENINHLQIQDFNNQNAIFSLDIRSKHSKATPYYEVDISSSYGAALMFTCERIIVHSITPFKKD
jgi:hypothetical protein